MLHQKHDLSRNFNMRVNKTKFKILGHSEKSMNDHQSFLNTRLPNIFENRHRSLDIKADGVIRRNYGRYTDIPKTLKYHSLIYYIVTKEGVWQNL